jgi:hypothetical protein
MGRNFPTKDQGRKEVAGMILIRQIFVRWDVTTVDWTSLRYKEGLLF